MKNDTNYFAKVAVLAAVAFVLMLVEFPLPFVPPFYKMDFSETAVLIGGFALGPMAGVIIEAIKIIMNVLFTGTQTAYVGEIANFLIGISFCLPAAIIYNHHKTKESAIRGLAAGGAVMCLVGMLMNALVLLPAYSHFFHIPMDALIGMGTKLVPLIHDRFTFVLFATTPFNLVKAVAVSLVTMLVYKRISPLLHR